MTNPWRKVYENAIKALESARSANEVPDLNANTLQSYHPKAAAAYLSDYLQKITVVSQQEREIARNILELGKYSAEKRYPSIKIFSERIHLDNQKLAEVVTPIEHDQIPPVFLTGLAGVGKTVLLRTILKCVGEVQTLNGMGGYSGLALVTVKTLTIQKSDSISSILARINPSLRGNTIAEKKQSVIRYLYLNGVSLLVVDELQFLTNSSASALMSGVLKEICRLGVQVVVVANYSAAHLLYGRPEQDRHRLLSNPEVLLPDPPETSDWKHFVSTLLRKIEVAVEINACDKSHALFWMTFGNKRNLRRLISYAYSAARVDNQEIARWKHFERAFKAPAYTDARQDVAILWMAFSTATRPQRKDLDCPFDVNFRQINDLCKAAKEAREDEFNYALAKASLNAIERQQAEKYEKKIEVKRAKNSKARKSKSVTSQSLLANFDEFLNAGE